MGKTVKREKRKQQILTAAKTLFKEKSFAKTTVNDILAATGLSKGGFYHHFKSKEAVLITLIDQLVADVVQEATVIARANLSALEKLQLFFEMNYRKKLPDLSLLHALDKGKDSDLLLYRYYTRVWENYLPPLTQIVEQGIAEGSMETEHPVETIRLLYKTMMFLHEIEPNLLQTAEQISRHLAALEQIVLRSLKIDESISLNLASPVLIGALCNCRLDQDVLD